MINFNVPPFVGKEIQYINEAIASHKICGDGTFTKKCHAWLEERFQSGKMLLTTSGSSALDMAALLCHTGTWATSFLFGKLTQFTLYHRKGQKTCRCKDFPYSGMACYVRI